MPQFSYPYPYAMNGVNTATANPMSYPYPNTPTYTYAIPYQGQNFTVNQPVQNQMQQTTPVNQMTPPIIHADIIQADEEQAKDYNIAAGTTQMFMSKDDKYIFIKTAYANGNYDIVRYVKDNTVTTMPSSDAQNDYVTREEFEKRLAEITYKPKYNKNHQSFKKEENTDG